MTHQQGPLSGVKVLDLTIFINGPSATGQLCEQGADVLKLEPASGDPMRVAAGSAGAYFGGFELFNRGKRSITLDLKHPGSKEVMKRLVQWADVLAENFKPGVMERLGLGYGICKVWNPLLIYATNSGFGPTGEWSPRPSYDGMAQAFTGALCMNGGGPSHSPRPVPWNFSDVVGGNTFYAAILAALFARERTGKGQHVICSQTGATLYFQRSNLAIALDNSGGRQADKGQHAWQAMCFQQVHRASDGACICMSMTKLEQLRRFCDAIGRSDLFQKRITQRWPVPLASDRKWLLEEVAATIAKRPADHWIQAMVKLEVPCAPVASYADVGDKQNTVGAHMYANGYICDVNHRDYGLVRWVGRPASFSETPNSPLPPVGQSWHAPYIGEQTNTTLQSLGFTAAETDHLVRSGAVPTPKGIRAIESSRAARQKYAVKMAERRHKFEALRRKTKSVRASL